MRVVSGPTPTTTGDAVYTVEIDGQLVEVIASPMGVGVHEKWCTPELLPIANSAMGLVHDAIALLAPAVRLELYLAGAKLRKASGGPPLLGIGADPDVRAHGSLERIRDGARLRVVTPRNDAVVCFSIEGGLMEVFDDWDQTDEDERRAVLREGIRYLVANPDEAAAQGLDASAFEEIYC